MARSDVQIDEAYLIGAWLESFFWGLYTFLFGMTLYSVSRKRRKGIKKSTIGASIVVLYALATTHMLLALVRLIRGFIFDRDTIGPTLYFADISTHLNMAKEFINITTLFLCDFLLTWRIYIVWGRNVWAAIIPAFLTIGEFIAGYGAISHRFLPDPVAMTVAPWGTAMFAMTMATNMTIAIAIAFRLWYIAARTQGITETRCNNHFSCGILFVIESGTLIAIAKLVEFVLFKLDPANGLVGMNARFIVYEITPQIAGLVPTCIVYTVINGLTYQDDYYMAACIAVHAHGGAHPTFDSMNAADNVSLSTVAFSGNDEWPPKRVRRADSGAATTACGDHSQENFELAVKKVEYATTSPSASSIMEVSVA